MALLTLTRHPTEPLSPPLSPTPFARHISNPLPLDVLMVPERPKAN